MELLPLAESWFSVLEFTLISPIYENIYNFTQTLMKLLLFAQMCFEIVEIYPNDSNFIYYWLKFVKFT